MAKERYPPFAISLFTTHNSLLTAHSSQLTPSPEPLNAQCHQCINAGGYENAAGSFIFLAIDVQSKNYGIGYERQADDAGE